MMRYLPLIVDAELADRLATTGAVVVEGPKACGKTATAESVAASAVCLDVDDAARAVVDLDPAAALEVKRVATSATASKGMADSDPSCPGASSVTGSSHERAARATTGRRT